MMTELELIYKLHIDGNRQGPGSKTITQLAFDITGISRDEEIKILDIGCGTGAQTFDLAGYTKAHITALDFSEEFLGQLKERCIILGLNHQVKTIQCSMDQLTFPRESFDLIWSEGAIYNMGFERGLQYWSQFLKPWGVIAVSEISWIGMDLPVELVSYWKEAYPEIDFVSRKIEVIEQNNLKPLGHIILPQYCWMDEYYIPLQNRFAAFIEKYGSDAELLVQIENEEIEFYQKYKDYYSYGFYIAQKKTE